MDHMNLAYQLLQATTPLALLLLVPLLLLLGHSISRGRHGSKKQRPKRCLPPSPPGLPIIGHLHLVSDLPHVSLRGLAAKHSGGGLMLLRFGTVRSLVVSSPRAAQLVLRSQDHAFASRPASKVADVLLYGSTDIGFSPYGEHWRHLRKLITTHLLSIKKVNSNRDARHDEVINMLPINVTPLHSVCVSVITPTTHPSVHA